MAASRPQPADPVFTRLLHDVLLAKDIQSRIERGLIARDHLDDMCELEARAWHHLAEYSAAVAFVVGPRQRRE
jgi:hypothetical protein